MNMRMYPKLDTFEQALLNLVAGRISAHVGDAQKIVYQLRNTFQALDTSCDGKLDKEELLTGLRDTMTLDCDVDQLEDEITDLFEELGQARLGSASSFHLDKVSETRSSSGLMGSARTANSSGMIGSAAAVRSSSGAIGSAVRSESCLSSEGPESTKSKVTLSYTEWLAATIGANVLASEEALSGAFHQLDASFKGVVSKEDLEGAIGEEAAASILAELGGVQSVSYDNFRKLARRVASKRWGIVPIEEPAEDLDSDPGLPVRPQVSEDSHLTARLRRVLSGGLSGISGRTSETSFGLRSLGTSVDLSVRGSGSPPYMRRNRTTMV